MIKAYREEKVRYDISEKTVKGKVVEVTIIGYSRYSKSDHTFYRWERCNEVLRSLKAKEHEELKRYK